MHTILNYLLLAGEALLLVSLVLTAVLYVADRYHADPLAPRRRFGRALTSLGRASRRARNGER